MKSLNSLIDALLKEVGDICGTDVERDRQEVAHRFEHEGESFLTISLPSFRKSFDLALAAGSIASVDFPGFRVRRGFPLFMGGLLRLVFDQLSGSVLSEPSADAIQGIRQVCNTCSKVFEVCDPNREAESFEGYERIEGELEEWWFNPRLLDELRRTATQVFGDDLRDLDRACASGTLVPRHGPGATADRLSGNAKYDVAEWPSRLDREFPVADYLLPGYSHHEHLAHVSMPDPEQETPVRVVSVPKTAAKARIIAMEPTAMQYAQQAVLAIFARAFSSKRASRFISLDDQVPNQVLAHKGSIDGSVATIDLSEASDRVAVEVVNAVFGNYPNLLACLTASRSIRASLPSGRVLTLLKFASMGSATCFPVESVVFATIALNGIRKSLHRSSLRRRDLARLSRTTRVFGDDIIVPTSSVNHVMQDLVALAAKPNPNKSFWTGKFRESCGMEYYAGEDVTSVYLRRRIPVSRRDAQGVMGLVSFRNQLYQYGYWNTAWLLDSWLADLRLPMPIVEPTSQVLGRHSVAFSHEVHAQHGGLQVPLVKGPVPHSAIPRSESSDVGKLLKCLLPGRTEPFADANHLERGGRPDLVRIKVRWAQPY